MATALRTSDNVLTEIVETLECPVCLNTISKPPVFRCDNDHIFCGECHGKLRGEGKDCPVCRQPLQAKRAFFAEKIIGATVVNRKCQNQGCEFQAVLPGQLETHQNSCHFREVECYFCSARVTLYDLYGHMNKDIDVELRCDYGTASVMSYGLEYSYKRVAVACVFVKGIPTNAWFIFFRHFVKGRYLHWVSHCQNRKNTEGFEYTISIICGKKKDLGKTFRLVRYTGLCPPIDTPLATIEKYQTCLTLPEDFIKNAVDKHGNYWCEFTIAAAK